MKFLQSAYFGRNSRASVVLPTPFGPAMIKRSMRLPILPNLSTFVTLHCGHVKARGRRERVIPPGRERMHGTWSKARSDSLRSLGRSDSETVCDGLLGLRWCHRIDISSRRDAGSAGIGFRTTRGPAASERILRESFSGRLPARVFKESLLLFAGQELVVARDRVEQDPVPT